MWVKIDDKFPQHRKIADAGELIGGKNGRMLALGMYLAGLCYANSNETGGVIPFNIVKRMPADKPLVLAGTLVEVKLWDPVAGGFRIHDYEDYNPTAAQIEQRRHRRSARARVAAEARWGAKREAHPDAQPMLSDATPSMPQASPKHDELDGSSDAWPMLSDAPVPVPVPVPVPDPNSKVRDLVRRTALSDRRKRGFQPVGELVPPNQPTHAPPESAAASPRSPSSTVRAWEGTPETNISKIEALFHREVRPGLGHRAELFGADAVEALKVACHKYRLAYDATAVKKALDSAEAKVRKAIHQ